MNNTDYHEIENYWVDRKKYCISFFKRALMGGKNAVYGKYGKEKGNMILNDVKTAFFDFLPDVPFVGEIDLMKRQMLLTVVFASFYKTLKGDESIAEIWKLCNNFNKVTLKKLPKFIRNMIKKSVFSEKTKQEFIINGKIQEEQNVSDQWDYIDGEGSNFDYGMNITKCGKLIFLNKIGYEEFLPYVCLIDKNFAECTNYGFKRTQTLAEGADYCDFRMSLNGPVEVKTLIKL